MKKADLPTGRLRERRARSAPIPPDEDVRLSRAWTRELERRLRDIENPTRYLLVSVLAGKFALYYDVKVDSYAWNDPRTATLFKRRAVAVAVRRSLGAGVKVVACRANPRGQLVVSSVPSPRVRRRR